MRRHQSEQVGTVIQQFLREEGLETPYNEYRLLQAWPEVVGQGVAQLTNDLQIRNRGMQRARRRRKNGAEK